MQYSKERKEAVLKKMMPPHNRSVVALAREEGISEDPIGFAGGDTNLMAYVGNNPVNFVDPWGLCGIQFGYSIMGLDINVPLYSTKNGLFSSPSVGVSTTLLGMGLKFYVDSCARDASNDVIANVGVGSSKYLSIGSNVQNGSTMYELNVGLGLGIPRVNASTSMTTFMNALSNNVLEPTAKFFDSGIRSVINRLSH